MTTPVTEELTTARCIECKVPVTKIEGTQRTPGRVPPWKHDWSAYATAAERPKCSLSTGPLWDDQVEGIPDDETTGDYPGEDGGDN